jgi:hypothetical protein
MERRSLFAGPAVLIIGIFAMSGSALAHKAPKKKSAGAEDPTCVVVSQPSFVDQGEFSQAGSVADIVEVHCQSVYAEQYIKLSATELNSRCTGGISWIPAPQEAVVGETVKRDDVKGASIGGVQLDDAGNATVALFGGPSCASGESLITAHLEAAPYETFTTSFAVLPPHATTPGVTTIPSSQIEDDITSSVATIVEVEFPSVYAEKYVDVTAEQLYARCGVFPYTTWYGPDESYLGDNSESETVQLDNSGNAFVVLFGSASCASGNSLIEASLTSAPYTTYTTEFTVKSPETAL